MIGANERSASGDRASSVLVGLAQGHESMRAPRATFSSIFLTRRPGVDPLELSAAQARIAKLRTSIFMRNRHKAVDLHDRMCAELMREVARDVSPNTVTTVGENDLLDKYFGGSAYTAEWLMGLINSVS